MRGKSILHDVSVSELLTMRETGMSNYEIAEALEVSEATVYRLIGKNPKGTPRRRRTPEIVEMPIKQPQNKPEEIEACLAVQHRSIECVGAYATYELDCMKQMVSVERGGEDGMIFEVSFDGLGELIKELSAIHRQLGKLKTKQELW